jgi:hypothetical protein
MDDELKQALNDLEKRIMERIERVEARLQDRFDDRARTYEVRVRGNSSAIYDLDERLALVEKRLSAMELERLSPKTWKRGSNYPPPTSPL